MTKIKPGDRVRFVNESLEGIVTSLENQIAGVTIDDDFEIPVPVAELVKITAAQGQATDVVPSNPPPKVPTGREGIFIAFDRISDTLLRLKLYNSSGSEILFAFFEKTETLFTLRKAGALAPDDIVELNSYDLEKFGEWPLFAFQIIQAQTAVASVVAPINREIRFSSREFHAAYKQSFFLSRQAYQFRLDEGGIPEATLEKLRQRDFSEKRGETQATQLLPENVVDLHAEKLSEDPSALSADDIITLQMGTFTKTLDSAVVHKMKKITFIHGVGNHFLKNRIRNYLALQKDIVASYKDADLIRYGGGATEVFLR